MSVEVNRKNILAILEHGNITRTMMKDAQVKIEQLENLVLEQKKRIDLFQSQVQMIQQKLYTGGATG